MLHGKPLSLWHALSDTDRLASVLVGVHASVTLGGLTRGSALGCRAQELSGRSVLIATKDPLAAALALIELDGIARRLVLAPPDLSPEHLPFVMDSAAVEAIVSDRSASDFHVPGDQRFIECGTSVQPAHYDRGATCRTEWILLTSGTTGVPKLAVHTLESLAGAIEPDTPCPTSVVWSTFYDIRRYGGLQIFLRAVLTGTSLVLSSAEERTSDFLARVGSHGVTHISGTPSHWRRALMDPSAHEIAPRYVRLSGEIADQTILNNLRSFYPEAKIVHAFASTEAGVAFEVTDGMAGFQASLIANTPGVQMKVEDGSLRIRSGRTAERYLGPGVESLKDGDGFVDTGDMLDLRSDRYYFEGRRDGVINVGGFKVHPEEVEAVINRHPKVQMSLVRGRKSPVTGAIVIADVVTETDCEEFDDLHRDILDVCRKVLPLHKVPATIRFVPSLAVAQTGKLIRHRA
jgi:acyl-coenzyme A synthetase/AMP-(fatty) acid ligase